MSIECTIGLIVLVALWGTREYFWREYRNRHSKTKKTP